LKTLPKIGMARASKKMQVDKRCMAKRSLVGLICMMLFSNDVMPDRAGSRAFPAGKRLLKIESR